MTSFLKSHWQLICILILSALLRLYQLGVNPPSLYWDEASLGYNAYSLLQTARDEYGNHLPFSIRSFNDYKPPLYTYLAAPSIAIFGLTEFAIRFPSAISGIFAVLLTYLLSLELFRSNPKSKSLSLVSAIFMALAPWHLHFSRAAFEANLALTTYLAYLLFFLKFIRSPHGRYSLSYLILSGLFAATSLYAYHSARLIIPLMALLLILSHLSLVGTHLKKFIIALLIFIIFVSPLALITLRGSSSARFSTVSVFTNPGEFTSESERITRSQTFKLEHNSIFRFLHHPVFTYSKIITKNYLDHFNFDFLFLTGDDNPRHGTGNVGVLYLVFAPFLLLGVYHLIRYHRSDFLPIWFILLLGPLAASLTTSTPHAIRSLLSLPAYIFIISYGFLHTPSLLNIDSRFIRRIAFGLFVLNVFYYLNLYYTTYPQISSSHWQYGYKQLVAKVNSLQSDYDNIFITNRYDQPHIYFALYTPIPPPKYQAFSETAHQHIDNITFKDIEYQSDIKNPNSLVITDPKDSPTDQKPFYQIFFPDGTVAFNFYSSD